MQLKVDTTFDFQSDTPKGKDPDKYSPTLRAYHKRLWSKPLPNGIPFDLVDTTTGVYLHHRSDVGEFKLSSDTEIPSYERKRSLADVIRHVATDRLDRFWHMRYTIGGMMVFPSNKVNGKMTINGARGCHPRIMDRFDLTVECIRQHYLGGESPLSHVLARYSEFFALFGSFEGYIDFFLLQDILSEDYADIKFHAPFASFEASPLPDGPVEYTNYLNRAERFILKRNRRIRASQRKGSVWSRAVTWVQKEMIPTRDGPVGID